VYTLLTNNPLAARRLDGRFLVDFRDGGYLDILVAARDMVHLGARLISHPLSSSLKPNETPYKSIVIDVGHGANHMQSIIIIEEAIAVCKKFPKLGWELDESILRDFMEIDCAIVN